MFRHDVPPGAIPHPVGFTLKQIINLQIAEVQASQFFIRRAAWIGYTDELGPAGQKQLDKIVNIYTKNHKLSDKIIIEKEKNRNDLNISRQIAIARELNNRGIEIIIEKSSTHENLKIKIPLKIIIGSAKAIDGLSGEEAQAINSSNLGFVSTNNTHRNYLKKR